MKQCRICRKFKEETEFVKTKFEKSGRRSECKDCRAKSVRKWGLENPLKRKKSRQEETRRRQLEPFEVRRNRWLKWKHGISLEEYNILFQKQNFSCAICKSKTAGGKGMFHVDHNHKCCNGEKSCGKCTRGLLCTTCNMIVVHFVEHYSNLFEPTLKYLEDNVYEK